MNTFTWTLEITIDEDLVADGLELANVEHALHRAYPLARTSGLRARVLAAPNPDAVARAQGYEDADDRRERRQKRMP